MSKSARVLDSSVVIRHFRKGGEISERLEACSGLYLPIIALGELYSGAARSARSAKDYALIATFISGATLLNVDETTAKHYGTICAQLAAKGTPIPVNDMWIAAIAVQYGITLATTDGHFSSIADLDYECW